MLKLKLLLFTFISLTYSFGQDSINFKVSTFNINQKVGRKKPADFKRANFHFYEDKYFIASKSCSGEWGGTLTFTEKATGNEYECSSTCPVVVSNINGKYIVTNTLAHMLGFSEILEIDNPTLLKKVKKTPKNKRDSIIHFVPIDEAESKSIIGTKIIADSIGILTLASFTFKEHLYHIITDFRKTYIADLFENKFHTIQLLSEKSIWTYEPEVIITKQNHYIIFFKNSTIEGYLDIYKNEITLYIFK